MKPYIRLGCLLVFLCGCAHAKSTAVSRPVLPGVTSVAGMEGPPGLHNIEGKDLEDYVRRKGVIFAKTDFEGIVKTSYVELSFVRQGEKPKGFSLHIEDNPGERPLVGKKEAVRPGYFFIELPAGTYKIDSIAIPVGSTVATEPLDISFEVIPNAITYIGTLKINGTKEKIKLGGVPVIQPGFEYETKVVDEQEEGIFAFHQRYPNISADIKTKLMVVGHPSVPEGN